jgi:hypothetical protein
MVDPATASAGAVEAVAKTTGQALDIVHDTGGYLNRVFGDLVVNAVGWIIGDWVGEKRRRNFDALCRRTIDILQARDVRDFIELSPNQATELLTAAQDESREELADLWARLLANAMDPNLNNVRHSFIEAVKKMDPMDAIVLQYIYVNQIASVRYGDLKQGTNTVGTLNISQSIGKREDEAQVSIRHLEALSFFDTQPSGGWLVNAINREFMRACYPEPAKA